MLHDGQTQSFEQISQWLGISPARVSQMLNLLLLSTRIQEEIFLSNQAKVKMVKENEAREIALKMDWEEQWRCWEVLQKIV
jgi:Mn-dependent DtxR family transcriptional regulator